MLEQGSTDSFQEILARLFFRLLSSFSLILIKIEYFGVYYVVIALIIPCKKPPLNLSVL